MSRARQERCRIITRTGASCPRPVAVGNQHTCSSHEAHEHTYGVPRYCEICEEPMPNNTTSTSTVCSKQCRNRRSHKQRLHNRPDTASYGPPCPRCGQDKTWITTGKDYICEVCGFMSDAADRSPGQICGPIRRIPAEVITQSRQATWRREVNAKTAPGDVLEAFDE